MANTFPVHLISNVPDYVDNQPNKFRMHLPKPIYLKGSWVCGLHTIIYPYSWPSTIGTLDDQWIKVHFSTADRERVLTIPVPKASHTKVEELKNFLNGTLKHQLESIDAVDKKYVEKPILNRRKRTLEQQTPGLPPKAPSKKKIPIAPPRVPTTSLPIVSTDVTLENVPSSEAKSSTVTQVTPVSKPLDVFVGGRPVEGEKNRSQLTLDVLSGATNGIKEKEPEIKTTNPVTDAVSTTNVPTQTKTDSSQNLIPVSVKSQISQNDKVEEENRSALTLNILGVVGSETSKQVENSTDTNRLQTLPKSPPTHTSSVRRTEVGNRSASTLNIIGLGETVTEAEKEPKANRSQLVLNYLLGGEWAENELGLVKHLISSVGIQYHKEFDRFRVAINDSAIKHLSFSPQLGYVLGFDNPLYVKQNEFAKYACDLRGGFSSFGVYCKGLTENIIIGNSLSSLLRIVSVSGATPGEYIEKEYNSPIFARVLPSEIKEIEVELRTMDNGRLVPFAYGIVTIVLIFKKVINF